ncbi:MAG: ATP-binding protein [Lachnospiraceae bacterium]|nr:ATP-binding protein [Lachnospiraceae bacterium]
MKKIYKHSSTIKLSKNVTAMVEGGQNPMPGEISLANNGVPYKTCN